MRKSLKTQIAVLFIGLIGFVFLANWCTNNFLLERYYVAKKEAALQHIYDAMNKVEDEDDYLTDEFADNLSEFCTRYNLSAIILTDEFVPLYGTENYQKQELQGRLWGYLMGIDKSETEVLKETNDYAIQKTKDFKENVDYLEMWGEFNTGYYFMMRVPMDSIRDSVRTSNEFLGYFIIIGLAVSMILISWMSRKITTPLQELTELSKRMADLDFDAKYTSGGQNEIGQLGEHFNRMSENLEKAYSELLTANNELQQDIQKKQKIDDMRKEFLSNVSHELKTPIALIQGYAEGLAECINDDAESRDFYCEVIMDEASKMNTMVQKLLTLNQLEFGNDKIVMERFDLAMLLKNKIQSIAILAQQKEAQISYSGKDSVYAWGDEFKIEEVITNYLSNALNHVSGAKKIEVRVEQDTEQVRVSVFNTGEQIPEADIGQIWDKFYKVDKARTREYGGSGVGLSIVKAIMESLNQKYGVENRPDGVEFWFTLKNGSAQKEEETGDSDAVKSSVKKDKNEICNGAWRKVEPDETQDSEEKVSEGRSTEDQGGE